ncbi:hypothetical protein NECAME_06259 [Necator americanus]|uniref:Uncharacterized protein n=1 Tax=Necator americanus TaxID=51031 RepID=W2TXH4_NECAM|nr:hypothetical protein NECAME_06259 [Necator americanus]ETN85746.1 hypothetical protein NECAME_06259 [Necator americanus]
MLIQGSCRTRLLYHDKEKDCTEEALSQKHRSVEVLGLVLGLLYLAEDINLTCCNLCGRNAHGYELQPDDGDVHAKMIEVKKFAKNASKP